MQEVRFSSPEHWIKSIRELKSKPVTLTSMHSAIHALKHAFKIAVQPEKNSILLLSGGLDSSLLALFLRDQNVPALVIGLPKSPDVVFAQRLSACFDIPLTIQTISLEDVEQSLRDLMKILDTSDVVKLSIGVITYKAAQLANALGFRTMYTGLGSEEIFCGYQRHVQAFSRGYNAIIEECWNGLESMWEKDFSRDFPIIKYYSLHINTPFLHPQLIETAMSIHPKLKLNFYKKYVLRMFAEEHGLPPEFSWRKKSAAQYGSRVDKAIQKIAKMQGYATKREYIASLQ